MKSLKVKFYFLALILSFISCKTNIGSENKNFILWKDTKQLTFKDFKGKPNNFGTDIYGYCATQNRFEHKIDETTKLPKFIIKCYFNKKKSFIRLKNKKDTLTLRHEQLHFNIEELLCRKTRKSWDSLYDLKERKITFYNKARYRNRKEINLLNSMFDQEAHSIYKSILKVNIEAYEDSILKRWEARIERELDELGNYK